MFTRPDRRRTATRAAAAGLAMSIALLLGACGATGADRSPADGQTPTSDTSLTAPESTDAGDNPEGTSATSLPAGGVGGDSGDSAEVDVTVDPQLEAALAELEALADQIDQQLRDAAAAAANGG